MRRSLASLALAGAIMATPHGAPQDVEWFGRIVEQAALEGVAGAQIEVIAPIDERNGDTFDPVAGGDVRVLRTAVADNAGGFAVDAPAGTYLRLSHPGFLDGFVRLHAGRDRDLGRLVLRHAMSFSGRLLRDGAPAAGVVVLAPAEHNHDSLPTTRSARATTDEAGRFHLGGLRPEQVAELVFVDGDIAEALGFQHSIYPFDARHYELGDIDLSPVTTVRGRVVGRNGREVGSAIVVVTSSSTMRLPYPWNQNDIEDRLPAPRTTTGADGRFTLELPAGEHWLRVFSPAAGLATESVVASAAGASDEVVIELSGTVAQRGRVTDAEGNPLAGAVLSLREGNDLLPEYAPDLAAAWPRVVTDANGCYVIAAWPADQEDWVDITRDGFVSRRLRIESRPPGSPPAGACDEAGTTVLEPAARIAGIVVDDRGEPVAGVEVHRERHQDVGGYFTMGPRPAVTNEAGAFLFEGLRFGDYTLMAWASGYANTALENLAVGPVPPPTAASTDPAATLPPAPDPSSGSLTVMARLVMPRIRETSPLEVVVFDPRGAPEPEAHVIVDLNENGYPYTARPPQRFTGADGRILYESLPRGPYSIAATAAARSNSSAWQSPYHVEEGAPAAIVEMRPVPERTSLAGRFVDTAGRGIARAIIEASGSVRLHGRAFALTDADGAFRFTTLPTGTYLLKASAPGYPEVIDRVPIALAPPGAVDIVIQVPATGVITGTVSGLRDDEVAQLSVSASTEAEEDGLRHSVRVTGVLQPGGAFRVEPVTPGTWTVSVGMRGGRHASAEVFVDEDGRSTPAEIALPNGFRLSGRLLWRDPTADNRAYIWLGGAESRDIEVGPSGEFEALDLPAGRYHLTITGGGLRAPFFADPVVDGDTEIEIEVRGASVRGRVVDAETGQPIPGVALRTDPIPQLTSDMHDQFRDTDRHGAFAVGPFPSGPWSFEFSATGYAMRAPIIEIGDQDIDDLIIELAPTPGLRLRFETPDGTLPRSISLAWLDLEHGEGFQNSAFPQSRDSMDFHWAYVGRGRGVLYAGTGRDRLAARLLIDNDGEPVVVPLQGAGSLYVDVAELADDEAGAVMTLFDAAGLPVTTSIGRLEWATRREGVFRVRTLPPGTYQVVVSARDGRTWTGQAEVFPFDVTEVTLR